MRILLCNTSERIGGAAIAARRLMLALRSEGVHVKYLVRDRATTDDTDVVIPDVPQPLLKTKFVAERIGILKANAWHKHRLWEVDSATHGIDLTRQRCFREADVVHLHWINQGLFSLRDIRKALLTKKPLVWTLHDMWPLTGICHHSRECEGWLHSCGNCPLLYKGSKHDLSYRRFQCKHDTYAAGHIHFVACSNWLADLARRAPLLQGHTVHSVPNPIDTEFFCPGDQLDARERLGLPKTGTIILFVAYKATDPNKGIDYLRKAIEQLKGQNAETLSGLSLCIVGREASMLKESFANPTFTYEYVDSEETMRDFYRSASLLAMPTLQDNLPNTIVEAMACGTPTVGFNVGGLPQLIHSGENGYLSQYKDAADFAHGMMSVLSTENPSRMSDNCRTRAVSEFSNKAVAEAYLHIYQQALG